MSKDGRRFAREDSFPADIESSSARLELRVLEGVR